MSKSISLSRRMLCVDALTIIAPPSVRVALAQSAWKTWRGWKFGTAIEYPSDLFTALPEPDAHDGRTFTAPDGARILAYAAFTNVVDFESAVAMTKEGSDYAEVAYRRRDKNWAVVSGYRTIDGRRSVFYERYFLDPGNEVYHTLVMTYPAEAKASYDPLVGRIAGSLDASRYSSQQK
jgi:hypothetical protein